MSPSLSITFAALSFIDFFLSIFLITYITIYKYMYLFIGFLRLIKGLARLFLEISKKFVCVCVCALIRKRLYLFCLRLIFAFRELGKQ